MTQEYRFRNTYRLTIMHLIIGTLFAAFRLFVLFQIVMAGQLTIGALITLTVIIFVVLINIQPARCRLQYKNNDENKIVHVDKQEKSISIKTNDKDGENKITSDQIEAIELFYSWNTNPITSDLGYSKIKLKDGQNIILTQLTIDQSIIKSLFKDKVMGEKTRFLNMIR